jgi:hypothetical protein
VNILQKHCDDIISSAIFHENMASCCNQQAAVVYKIIYICKCRHTNFHPSLQLNKVMAVPQLEGDLDLSDKLHIFEMTSLVNNRVKIARKRETVDMLVTLWQFIVLILCCK